MKAAGVSLAEVLVALTVLALASTASMMLYNGARRSFKVGSNLTEVQQNVRIAFDELNNDIRLAGFNVKPDASSDRPDEQLEATFPGAIVLRYDRDAADPVASRDPEEDLADIALGAKYHTVSTGNDEVIAYVLANDRSTDNLVFDADLEPPVRDGTTEPIQIASVSLEHDDPPYTLYRVTFDENALPVRSPLIDNVAALRFIYYDDRGVEVPAAGGLDDEDGVNAATRGLVRRVGIEVEGLTRDPDLRWSDGSDGTAGKRTFTLASDVTPRNLGLFGVRDLADRALGPSIPAPPRLFPGHCGGFWIEWSESPPHEAVASYELHWGEDPAVIIEGPFVAGDNQAYVGGLLDDTEYFFTLTAVDDAGAPSGRSAPASEITENVNTPVSVEDLAASDGEVERVLLSWTEIDENTEAEPGRDPEAPLLRDLAGYRVLRDGIELAVVPGATYIDETQVNCRSHRYEVIPIDLCGVEAENADEALGESTSESNPRAISDLDAYWTGTPNDSPVRLEWSPVTLNVDGRPIFIADYKIYRAYGPPGSPTLSYSLRGTVDDGSTEWTEPFNVTDPPGGDAYHYYVVSHDDCVNESAPSNVASPDCEFHGNVVLLLPVPGAHVQDPGAWLRFQVADGYGNYQATFRVIRLSNGQTVFTQSGVVNGPDAFQVFWDTNTSVPGPYRIQASATQLSTGCVETRSVDVFHD